MSIAKPFTFTANTYAKASEVNANFDLVYSQVNTNISAIATNATDIDTLENNKADINGSSSNRFAVADPVANADAVNLQSLKKAIGNSLDYISGLVITKDSGSPEDTIIVSAGSCYDSTKAIVLSLSNSTSKQNLNQGANTTYYVYIIGNSTGSLIDILISSSSTTPTLPAGYSLFRQIGSYTTDSSSHISSIAYYGLNPSDDKSISYILDNIIPDYTSGISFNINTDVTIEKNGLLVVTNQAGNNGYDYPSTLYINSVEIGTIPSTYKPVGTTSCFLVSKGDVIRVNTDRGATIKLYPLKGAV